MVQENVCSLVIVIDGGSCPNVFSLNMIGKLYRHASAIHIHTISNGSIKGKAVNELEIASFLSLLERTYQES